VADDTGSAAMPMNMNGTPAAASLDSDFTNHPASCAAVLRIAALIHLESRLEGTIMARSGSYR
jgi:hypothetical protein